MRKIIASILMVGMIATSLVACGSSDKVEESNVLRVGMDLTFPPYSYIGDDGEAKGLEPVISEAFAQYLGMEVEIVNTSFSMLIPALETGDIDIIIADMSVTEERMEKVDFSDAYRYTNTLGLVNKEFALEHGITDEMPEEEFFAISGAKFIGKAGTKGVYYPQGYGVDVTEVTEIGMGLTEVSSGMSHVLIASNEIHSFQAADPDNTIVYAGILDQNSSSFGVKKGDTEMLEKANEFIASMYEEGGLYDQIREEFDVIVSEFLQNPELGFDYIITPQESN